MQTMHPTLLIGPADWNPRRFSRMEFAARLDRLWSAAGVAAGLIVYGNAQDHDALAYLTHATPKLEPIIALIARDGAMKLLVGGGANMLPAARPLTFVEDLLPLRDAAKTIADWAKGLSEGELLLMDAGNMPHGMHFAIHKGLQARKLRDAGEILRRQMQDKSPAERAALEETKAIVATAGRAAKEAQRSGKGLSDVILAAEHAAIERGARDVRALFSVDDGRTFRPLESLIPQKAEKPHVYVAVSFEGYWADEKFVLS